jgi:3',5'-cyclic AMP phosphodiesterase CpdA
MFRRPPKGIDRMKKCLLLIVVWLMPGAAAFASSWSFAVAGDDRTNVHPKVGAPDQTGINRQVAKMLLRDIKRAKPEFLLFTGDLVCGENTNIPTKIVDQFCAWTNLAAMTVPRLAVYPIRGNHETYGDATGACWLKIFKPGLDAKNVSYLPGEEGFSYSFPAPGHPETLLIALDQFMPGRVHRVNLGALENVLKQATTNHVKHIFVFSHEMAFTCTSHPDSENMAAFPVERDQFVQLLERFGVEYFFAGHDHAYDWMAITHPQWPTNYVLNQIVAGTAGAPFYPDQTYFGNHHGYKLTRLDHKQNTYGYLLVRIEDDTDDPAKAVTVTFKSVRP